VVVLLTCRAGRVDPMPRARPPHRYPTSRCFTVRHPAKWRGKDRRRVQVL